MPDGTDHRTPSHALFHGAHCAVRGRAFIFLRADLVRRAGFARHLLRLASSFACARRAASPARASCRGTSARRSGRRRSRPRSADRPSRGRSGSRSRAPRPGAMSLDRLDEHAALLDLGLAVRIARVIDEARVVAADAGVDDRALVDDEQERVVVVLVVVLVALVRLLVRDAVAEVLDRRASPFLMVARARRRRCRAPSSGVLRRAGGFRFLGRAPGFDFAMASDRHRRLDGRMSW